ncbi:sensor histidine kinase [Loigolactobacillus binensis]|uniref:histidine kinase n=1 Tax=Loigolactobacillus binensis TaxID=2559922 RepID=A0ABW3EB70_9LACO|nr:sensor histidine kinase [Loigolactobacillus binensis]
MRHKEHLNLTTRKWISYIWLVYLPYTIALYLPINTVTDWFWSGLSVVFLVTYVLVIEVPRWRSITMPMELLITGLFSVFAFNFYLIIFPGWQIATILAERPKKYFRWFVTAYYAFLLSGVIRFNGYHPGILSLHNGAIVELAFPFISPIFAYLLASSMFRQRQLHQTNRRLQTIIQRDERERITRDLHDTLGQSFSMITIKTELAKKLLQKAPNKVAAELDDIEQTSRQNLQMVRKIVNNLHQKSLSETLLEQSKNLATAGVLLSTHGEEAALKWPTAIQSRLAAAMTEALTNVIRHANAHSVTIQFLLHNDHFQVLIQDDGHSKQLTRAGANGITGMQARMLEAKGTFTIVKNKKGTLVTLKLPKE